MAVFTRFSGGFCILRVCVAPAAPPPLWAVPGPPGHEKRTPTDADAHDLKIVVKLRAVPASKVPFPVEIAGFPDFSRPVPVYPAFLKYVVPVQCCLQHLVVKLLFRYVRPCIRAALPGKADFLFSPTPDCGLAERGSDTYERRRIRFCSGDAFGGGHPCNLSNHLGDCKGRLSKRRPSH